ncbi:Bardet-Biedl syndrome 4 protein homolog [Belonocnema kinseyi]|uniref:Bardet-Biedl syndrome 4 protein homolog n=1 Tax=Belonocnema kinseyi TaxID=2817044 RepID=UPI00143E0C9F|nr:Bardet-Biedl syndrome 4 protein homolog [Belonocnema kinseyi]
MKIKSEMANNVISNGRIQHANTAQRTRSDQSKKVPDIPAVEVKNWLLHRHYTRHEYRICNALIDEELSKSNGENEYANYLKGLILRTEGNVQEALECFQKCYQIDSSNLNNRKQIAKTQFLLGHHAQAVKVYVDLITNMTTPDWETHHNLGECYIKLNQPEDAIKQLNLAIEFTKNEVPHLTLAKFYVSQDRVPDAVSTYVAALKIAPENEKIATELGLLYLQLGDNTRAIEQFETALSNSPNYSKALLSLGFINQMGEDYDTALSKYKIASHSTPESWSLWNNIGMCFYGKQKFVAAISCLKKAHYLNPLALPPACNLGTVFLTTGQPASAATYLCAAVSASPEAVMPYLLLGRK